MALQILLIWDDGVLLHLRSLPAGKGNAVRLANLLFNGGNA